MIWEAKKIGRNDPCYCGSGKKYKQCCLLARAGSNMYADQEISDFLPGRQENQFYHFLGMMLARAEIARDEDVNLSEILIDSDDDCLEKATTLEDIQMILLMADLLSEASLSWAMLNGDVEEMMCTSEKKVRKRKKDPCSLS